MVLYTITGLLLAWLAYMNKDHLHVSLAMPDKRMVIVLCPEKHHSQSIKYSDNRTGQETFSPLQERSKIPDTHPTY